MSDAPNGGNASNNMPALPTHSDAVSAIRTRLTNLQTYVRAEVDGCLTQLDALEPAVKNDFLQGVKSFLGIG